MRTTSRSMEEEKIAGIYLIAALLAAQLDWTILMWLLLAKVVFDTLCSWYFGAAEAIMRKGDSE